VPPPELHAEAGPQTFPIVPAAQQPDVQSEFFEQVWAQRAPLPKLVQYPLLARKSQQSPLVEHELPVLLQLLGVAQVPSDWQTWPP
jgi:hypothetical protein